MITRHLTLVIFISMLFTCLLSACGGNPEPARDSATSDGAPSGAEPVASGIGEEQVTMLPTSQSSVTPEEEQPGERVIIGSQQEPVSLNPLLATTAVEGAVSSLVFDGLVEVDAAGHFVPVLAEDLPEVSGDGRVLTYRLREGLHFSDGVAVTCADVRFTWQAIMSGYSHVGTAGYREIETIDCPDDRTIEVTFNELYAPYLTLFPYIVPASAGSLDTMNEWELNRRPIGTGPWVVEEWKTGERITFAPNPHYRKEGKPYLDQVILEIVPSREAGMQRLGTGEITVLWSLSETDIPELEKMADEGVTYAASATGENEVLVMNLGDPSGTAPGDPDAAPHPILHDGRVREAIELAIDKEVIVAGLLGGHVNEGTTVLPVGHFACPQDLTPYDPERARELLTAAGWQPGPDGIRQRNGVRLSLAFQTTSGNRLREDTEKLLSEMLQDVGIELRIDNIPSHRLFAGWDSEGIRNHGQFDIVMYSTGPGPDPARYLFINYHSSQIPVIANSGRGANYSRYINEEVDRLIEEAASSTDIAERREAYCQVAEQISEDLPRILLYERLTVSGYREALEGFQVSPGPASFAQGSEDWLLTP